MSKTHDPFDYFCGDGWYINGYLQDGQGNALNLTGVGLLWALDDFSTPPVNQITLTIGNGINILDPINGIILVQPSAVKTTAVPPGIYRDSLRVFPAIGDPYTEWTGIIRAAAALPSSGSFLLAQPLASGAALLGIASFASTYFFNAQNLASAAASLAQPGH
jgi:hypothetical protein